DTRWPSLATTLHTRRENCQLFLAPSLPPVVLQKLAISLSWEVRYLVALHPQTPREARQRLCQDGNRYVRAMARAKMVSMDTPVE
ncbi:MAG TPA: hypothetical protein VFN35_20880, partial [Ktedonobacteraceae bacterium]|nr:hypothetical protein [Ktedonobacteraceae bacterium]